MLTNVKIKSIRALREARLNDLGRINVVCGKNNSGKSTLLSGFLLEKNISRGKFVTEENLTSAAENFSQGTIYYDSNNKKWTQIGRNVLDVFLAIEKRVWYQDEREVFVQSVQAQYQNKSILKQFQFPGLRVASAFDGVMSFPVDATALIPPKRFIELACTMHRSEVASDGRGLLSYLFFAKNKESEASERKHYDLLSEKFYEISSGCKFEVVAEGDNQIKLRFRNNRGVSADAGDCGLGLQDLLVLLYFITSPNFNLVLIEEPESHFHPELQRRLLAFMATQEGKQFILATHSNIFLDSAFVDKVFLTRLIEDVLVSDETNRALLLGELGYQVTDNLVSDLTILVEGPSDVPVLEHFLIESGVIPNYVVKFWPLGGDIMGQLDLSLLIENKKVLALVDRDPKSSKVRERFKEKCLECGIVVHQLERYAIENYFSIHAIRSVFKDQVPETLIEINFNKRVSDQLGFDVKKNSRNIVRNMTLDDLRGTDLGRFISDIKAALEGSS